MKNFPLSLLTLTLLTSLAFSQENFDDNEGHNYEMQKPKMKGIELVDGWSVSGDIRVGWVQYDYKNKPIGIDANGDITPTNPNTNQGHIDSQGIYTTPKISLSSPQDSRIKTKLTVAGATDFGINDEKYEKRTFVFDPNERKPFILLQEVYIAYEDKEHKLLVGREGITTPMFDSDDWYMLENSFEIAYYQNSSLLNTKLMAGYFSEMSGVWDGGDNGTEFNSMSQASFLSAADKAAIGDKGIYFASLEYNDEKNHNLQLWNYYGDDMYNTFFLQYDYTDEVDAFSYDLGAQFINFHEVGYLATSSADANINFSIYSLRFDGKFSNGFDIATGASKYSDGEGEAEVLGAFGGYPYFANGMIFHFFEPGNFRNASSSKAQIGYDFAKFGVKNLWLGYRYTYYDLDANYSTNKSGEPQNTMILNGVRVSYGDKLGVYFTGTYEHVNLDNEPHTFALRLIGGYRF